MILILLYLIFILVQGNYYHANLLGTGTYIKAVGNIGDNIVLYYPNKIAIYSPNMLNEILFAESEHHSKINICQVTDTSIIIIENKEIYEYEIYDEIYTSELYTDQEVNEFVFSCIKEKYYFLAYLNSMQMLSISKIVLNTHSKIQRKIDLNSLIYNNKISCTALINYIICFYINSNDKKKTNYILYDLSLTQIKIGDLKQGNNENNGPYMIEPKGDCNTLQVESVRIKDNSFLLGILKNQGNNFLYAVTAYADNTDIHKLSTKSVDGNFASTFYCEDLAISIAALTEYRYATLCKSSSGNFHLLSIITIEGEFMIDNTYLKNKEISYMTDQVHLVSVDSIGLGIFYRDNNDVKFIMPEYPICEDITLPDNSDSKISLDSEYSFSFNNKIFRDIFSTLTNNDENNFLISVFPYDYTNTSHNSIKIYHDNDLIPADISMIQKKYLPTNWKLKSGKIMGEFHYTYQVYYSSSSLGVKKCYLNITVSCSEGCLQCSVDSTRKESTCNVCDTSNKYYLFVPGKTPILVCKKNTTDITGYYLTENNENGEFKECNEACAKCYGPYNTNCMVTDICINNTCCNSNYYALEDKKNECYQNAPDGYYKSESENIFKKCPNYCKTCNLKSNDEPICITCNTDNKYYPLQKYNFVLCYKNDEKPIGYYFDVQDLSYKKCSNACESCSNIQSNSNTNCIVCKTDYYEDPRVNSEYNKNCLSSSQEIDNYYFDNTLKKFLICPDKCLKCSMESLSKTDGKCLQCNIDAGYYPLFNNSGYLTCIKEVNKPDGTYLDINQKIILQCYQACETCTIHGKSSQTNCLECKTSKNFIEFSTDPITNFKHCIINCEKNFYIFYNQYKCCDTCPPSYPYLDLSKKQCFDECPNYIYNNMCYDKCPDNTKIMKGNICFDDDQCMSSYSTLNVLKESLSSIYYDSLIKDYLNEYSYTNNHISFIENELDEYVISIYQNEECTNGENEKNLIMLDLADCPHKLRTYHKFNDSVIFTILTINFLNPDNSYEIQYYIYNSQTKQNIDLTPCSTINIIKKIKDEVDIDKASNMEKIGVNVFDINDEFFTNICFEYTENGKDVVLADRVKYYYQNVTCGEGCSLNNIDIKKKNINCSCSISESKPNIFDNKITGEIYNFFQDANFDVLKCYKEVFQYKFWIKNLGNIIMLILIFINCIFVIVYSIQGLFGVRCYLSQFIKLNPPKKKLLTNNDNNLIENHENKNVKKNLNKTEGEFKEDFQKENEENYNELENGSNFINISDNSNDNNKSQKKNYLNLKTDQRYNKDEKRTSKELIILPFTYQYFDNEEPSFNSYPKKRNKIELKKEEKDSKDLLNSEGYKKSISNVSIKKTIKSKRIFNDEELDNMSFENALKYDKRKFCEFYWKLLKEKQSTINTFFNYNPMRPFSIKVLVYIFSISVIFTLNCLFITESYIRERYNTKGNLGFSYILSNAINRIFYSVISAIFINFFISCLFDGELRIKSLVKREQNDVVLRQELNNVIRKMKIHIIIFIICTFLIMCFFWYYLSTFCNCYHGTQLDWLIGSLICIFFVQLFPFILCLLYTTFWYFGIKCKLEILFRISHCMIS